MLFSLVSQVLLLLGHLSQHAKAANAEGLTFSDPIFTKKSARNLNLYNFCHSPKKLAAVSPMITIEYGSILRPSSNNWASYRRLKWQIPALFL
jgi:hypothetical protein